jgi:hypothetical protein
MQTKPGHLRPGFFIYRGEQAMMTVKMALALYPDRPAAEIADMAGVAIGSVYSARWRLKNSDHFNAGRRRRYEKYARMNGVRSRAELSWSKDEMETLRKLWMTTSARQIGVLIGRSKSAVIGMANRKGLPIKRHCPAISKAWATYRRDIKQIEKSNA